jgi:uncharacterized membrane protein
MSCVIFSISDIVEKSWNRFKQNPFFWIGLALLNIIINPPATLPPFVSFPLTLFSLYISASITLMSVKYMRSELVGFSDLISIDWKTFFNYILFTITAGVAVGIGLLLFVIPGLYLVVKLIFAPFLIVDQKMGFDQAIEQSWKMTAKNEGKLIMYILTILMILCVGFFLFVFGFIVAVAVVGLSNATLYLTFINNDHDFYFSQEEAYELDE